MMGWKSVWNGRKSDIYIVLLLSLLGKLPLGSRGRGGIMTRVIGFMEIVDPNGDTNFIEGQGTVTEFFLSCDELSDTHIAMNIIAQTN
jgi:hypothetical protein